MLPFALLDGDKGRFGWRDGESRGLSVACAFRPTAQSGRAGRGCCDDAVDVYVRRDDDEVVEDEAIEETSSLIEEARLYVELALLLDWRREVVSLGPTDSPFMGPDDCP